MVPTGGEGSAVEGFDGDSGADRTASRGTLIVVMAICVPVALLSVLGGEPSTESHLVKRSSSIFMNSDGFSGSADADTAAVPARRGGAARGARIPARATLLHGAGKEERQDSRAASGGRRRDQPVRDV